jgi:streptomycin 3"-adenylyltransferase
VEPPAPVREFVSALVEDLVSATIVRGAYVHGSAVLGDWHATVSDIDLLVVVADASPSKLDAVAAILSAPGDHPGVGLEASVVAADAACTPSSPWPFLLHVATGAHDRKTVSGRDRAGDADLVLHYVVARAAGWSAYGPPARDAIGPIADVEVLAQLANELRWAISHASESYAVLNACRALRYCDDRTVCSKTDAGRWVLRHQIEPDLVRRALDQRRSGITTPVSKPASAFVAATADRISPGA